MIRHYLTAALRNFRRRPVATGINVLALSLGLTCFMIAYAVVNYWGHAEHQFAKADRTYVMTESFALRDGSTSSGALPSVPAFADKYIKADFPGLETVARARQERGAQTMSAGDKKAQLYMSFADPAFLDIFDFRYLAGDGKTAFSGPDSVILTEAAATRLYGTPAEAIGKTLRVAGIIDATVTGVIHSVAQPSHLGDSKSAWIRFDVLASWDIGEKLTKILQNASESSPTRENWLSPDTALYMVLPKDGSLTLETLKTRLKSFADRRVSPDQRSVAQVDFGAVPVSQVFTSLLDGVLFSRAAPGLSVTTLLFALGGLVLLVAGLNYANLATAQTLARAKEVGMRKVVGASRGQVMVQYVFEAGLLTAAAAGIALGVIELINPGFKSAADMDLGLALYGGIGFWVFLIALVAVVSLLAGFYPAFILSRVRPMQALRSGTIRTGPRFVPALLVGAQFCAASFLLIAVIVMYTQNRALEQTGLGGDDPLVVIANRSDLTKVKPAALRSALEQIPQVKSVTGMGSEPWDLTSVRLDIYSHSPEEGAAQRTAFESHVDYGYFSTLGIRLLAGRAFDRDRGDDEAHDGPQQVVIDQAFARQLGFATPEAAVGRSFYLSAIMVKNLGLKGAVPFRIIGVADDKALHFIGLGATGSVYHLDATPTFAIARISGADVAGARKAIEAAWNRLAPDTVLDMTFMDVQFERNYALFREVNGVFGGLAMFAFVISAIGLFGMALQIVGRRTHEIGVRKTLGASTRQIVAMLLKDFSRPVVIANLVAWPLGFLAAQVYLSVFVHRVSLTVLPFVLSLAITVLIAWAAVAGQAILAARTKPAAVLRYE